MTTRRTAVTLWLAIIYVMTPAVAQTPLVDSLAELRPQLTETEESERAKQEAYFESARQLMATGGAWDIAHTALLDCLRLDPDIAQQAMGILAVHGDETAVSPLLRLALRRRDDVGEEAGRTLTAMPGRAVTNRLIALHKKLPPRQQAIAMAILNERGGDDILALLVQAAQSDNAYVRETALTHLAQAPSPEALQLLLDHALADSAQAEQYRTMALDMATVLAAQNQGGAWPAIARFRLSEDMEIRREALRAMAQHPDPAALALVDRAIQDPALTEAARPAAGAVASRLIAAGQVDRALELYSRAGIGLPESLPPTQRAGFMTDYQLCGPFETQDLASGWDAGFIDEQAAASRGPSATSADWQEQSGSGPTAQVDLTTVYGMKSNCFVYAYTEVNVDAATDAQLRMGSDDGIAAWINGEEVWRNAVLRGIVPDNDTADIRLKAGMNRVLFKVSQGAAGWGFCARLTSPDGFPLQFQHE